MDILCWLCKLNSRAPLDYHMENILDGHASWTSGDLTYIIEVKLKYLIVTCTEEKEFNP